MDVHFLNRGWSVCKFGWSEPSELTTNVQQKSFDW